ncbi:hypothetical protein ACTFIV_005205 [Dictyostelium citrinum]
MSINRLDWDLEIISIEFVTNNSVNSSTGQTPFAITLGFEPRTPLNINASYNLPHIEATEYYRQATRDNLINSQTTMSMQYNKDRDDFVYEIGDLVLVKKSKLNSAMLNDKDQHYQNTNQKSQCKREIHVSYMKPLVEGDHKLFRKEGENYKPLDEEIEKITGKEKKPIGRGSRMEYKVRFKGKPEDQDTWLPLYGLENCGKLLREYEQSSK